MLTADAFFTDVIFIYLKIVDKGIVEVRKWHSGSLFEKVENVFVKLNITLCFSFVLYLRLGYFIFVRVFHPILAFRLRLTTCKRKAEEESSKSGLDYQYQCRWLGKRGLGARRRLAKKARPGG